jgi:hypothetical protein
MLKTIAVALALFGGLAAATLAAKPAPQAFPSQSFKSQPAAGQTFAGTCSATATVDSRVEPAWVGQSYAGDGCAAPALPQAVDGYTASRAQVLAGMAAQKTYIAQADIYQRCIADFVAARRGKRPIDVALNLIETHRLAASQADQQKVAAQVQIAIRTFNEAGSEDCK